MNVILNPANLQSGHFMMASDAADVFPDAIFNFRFDEGCAILRAENDVIEQGGVGVCHVLL